MTSSLRWAETTVTYTFRFCFPDVKSAMGSFVRMDFLKGVGSPYII
jgi:hypothetical protein